MLLILLPEGRVVESSRVSLSLSVIEREKPLVATSQRGTPRV